MRRDLQLLMNVCACVFFFFIFSNGNGLVVEIFNEGHSTSICVDGDAVGVVNVTVIAHVGGDTKGKASLPSCHMISSP